MSIWGKMKSKMNSLGQSIKESDEVKLQRTKAERDRLDKKLATKRELREENWQVQQRRQELGSYNPFAQKSKSVIKKGKRAAKQTLSVGGKVAYKAAHGLAENIRSNRGSGGAYGSPFGGDISGMGFTVYDTAKKKKKNPETKRKHYRYEPRYERRYRDDDRDDRRGRYERYEPVRRRKPAKKKKKATSQYLF